MARIRRRRADDSPEVPLPTEAAAEAATTPVAGEPATEERTVVAPPAETPDQGAGSPDGAQPAAAVGAHAAEGGGSEPTAPLPVPVEGEAVQATEVPAGAEPAAPAKAGFRDRGRMRRRLRYLRRLRELGFRDVGGLVFDLDRFGRNREDLVRAKLDALAGVDTELRTLELALDDVRPLHELREPGISACARCGALHGSDARFCPACGLQLGGPLAVGGPAPGLPPAQQAAEPTTETATDATTAVESASGATSEPLASAPNGSGPAHSSDEAAGSDPDPLAPAGEPGR